MSWVIPIHLAPLTNQIHNQRGLGTPRFTHNQHKVVEVLGQRVRNTRVDLVAIEFEFGQADIGTTRLLADAHLL